MSMMKLGLSKRNTNRSGLVSIMAACALTGGLASISVAAEPEEQSIDQKIEDFKNLLELASKEGWVELKSRPQVEPIEISESADLDSSISETAPAQTAADCSALVPLLDIANRPDSYLAKGFFAEAVSNDEISDSLGQSLSALLGDAWHISQTPRTQPVPSLDLTQAAGCEKSLLIWQALASPAPSALAGRHEADLIRALSDLPRPLRERAGIALALKAVEHYDIRGAQRIADTLRDSDLFGTPAWQNDPRHIRLQAHLIQTSNPALSGEYLRYLADRDNVEQMAALDTLWELDQRAYVEPTLDRLADSPDETSRIMALQRRAVQSVSTGSLKDASIAIADLSQSGGDIPQGLVAGLQDKFRLDMQASDPQRRIEALDAFMRIEAEIGRTDPDLQARLSSLAEDARARLDEPFPAFDTGVPTEATGSDPVASLTATAPASTFRVSTASRDENIRQRVDRFNLDLAQMREVLARE